ncbi:HD domain-containing protein [Microbacterium sp. C7(2022)]|uniref:HD domain-containing protein n=1 Tax=Microbacterium sp. C7(2022) TaxID=2992759 RepID=UPI00237AB4D6|nr:HD domain-containing protein [Microbacterium sp. C7(2022)]MDE0545927.1 HD domain-containing protein [Microbacterium sp. C7(2022)]
MIVDLAAHARTLAERQLVEVPRRWAHVQGVAATAAEIASALNTDHADDIVAAAWLHDVGYAPDLAKTGFHPVDGARFARDQGMPDLVVRLIAFHTGAEFEARQRGLLAELEEFTPPPSEILDVVTFADMTTSPTGEPIAATDRVAEILTRYEPNTPVYDAVSASAPELLAAVDRVNARLARVGVHPR